jgi:hypothetical protein
MNKFKLLIPAMLLLTLSASTGSQMVVAKSTEQPVESRQLDKRAEILSKYLESYDSPLQYHAQDFVDAADEYNVDWKLVPSIAGVESTFGKHIPGGHGEYISYNAWGWGVYGDQSLGFRSWRDGIYTVTGGLRKGYLNKGLNDPYAINKVYAASPTWGAHVTFFLNDLNKFTANYQSDQVSVVNVQSKIAGSSAQIAYIVK